MMRVLFVISIRESFTPLKPLRGQIQLQFGISYISAFLKENGHDTNLLVITREMKKHNFLETIREFDPKLICFTSVSSEYSFIRNIASQIKAEFPSIYLLIGGPHASLNPQIVIEDAFDSVCIGEGEYPTLELIHQLEEGKEPTEIRNLWIKGRDTIEKNQTREFLKDLDCLPFPDRTMWQNWIESKDTDTQHVMLLGRGCPYHCTYCSNHALAKLAHGKYVRFRTAENVIDELRHLMTEFPSARDIYFEVETITMGLNMDFAYELCRKLEQFNHDYKELNYGVNLRVIPSVNYDALFQSFKNANFNSVNIGIESGSQRIREKVLRRYYSNEDILLAVRLAKKHGLKVNVYIMIGLPEESLEDFKETINICRLSQPDQLRYGIFHPYPGTELHQYCRDKGLLPERIDTGLERRTAVLNLPSFSKREIQKQNDWFFYNVYRGHKPMYIILLHTILAKLASKYVLLMILNGIRRTSVYKKVDAFKNISGINTK